MEDDADCFTSQEVKFYSLETPMQRIEHFVEQETNSAFTSLGFKFPCQLKNWGRGTTSLDFFS